MEKNVASIARFAHSLKFEDLPDDVVHLCKRSIVDTFGVSLAALDCEPVRIARELALRGNYEHGAYVLGTQKRTLPELAAFANGVMARYLDGNDTFPGGGGHPSDMLAAVFSIADSISAGGRALITAMTIAYEVYHKLWAAAQLRDKGMDSVFYTTVAGAAAAAKLLGASPEQIEQAISLAVVPNLPLDATRYGHLSMWKGCAGPNAARNAVWAAILAEKGVTGPDNPFLGQHGLEKIVGAFRLPAFKPEANDFSIREATLKCHLSEAHSLSAITAALDLSKKVKAADIEKVSVFTYWYAWDAIGREPSKWRPTTREAADHSLPYIVAVILLDHAFSDTSFAEQRLSDPQILSLMDKIQISEDKSLTKQFPDRLPCRIEITTINGERTTGATDFPRGHKMNPMSDEEVNAKFRSLASRVCDENTVNRALEALWNIESAENAGEIFSILGTIA